MSMGRWIINPKVEAARIRKAQRECPTSTLSPEDCIRKALDKWGDRLAVSWSGGRCSTVVLYMALHQKPDISVIFNDTGIEFPETYRFIKRITEEWDLNLTITKPEKTFWECVDLYGFPMIRGKYHDRILLDKEGKPMCCTLLKENPLKMAMLRHRIYASLTGIRVCESRMRMFGVAQYGQYYYTKKFRIWRYHPIAFWDTAHLLDYMEEQGLPQNEIYAKGHTRCGCWPCTGYLSWREQLSHSHPRMYEKLNRMVKKMEGEPTLWEYETCPEEVLRREAGEAEALILEGVDILDKKVNGVSLYSAKEGS